MLRNYIKIAFRNLQRNRAYALINITGLALGLSCVILIFMLVKYHFSFEDFHPAKDRIYRVVAELKADNVVYTAGIPNPLAKALKQDMAAAEKITQQASFPDEQITVQRGAETKLFKVKRLSFVEPAFFEMFNFPLLRGKMELNEPNTVLLTQKEATKYFGEEDPLNKVIRLGNRLDLKVSGILKDIPANTDHRSEMYISHATFKSYKQKLAENDSWSTFSSSLQCYVMLKPNTPVTTAEQLLLGYKKMYNDNDTRKPTFFMQPLSDKHFNVNYQGVMEKKTLWILSFIGLFLIITACVNFINLATAQAVNRSREVGVRKVLGSQRSQLFWQFIAETGLITFSALLLAIVLSTLLLPYINIWFSTTIVFAFNWQLAGFIVSLLLVTTLLSGAYPGLILAGFQPVQALQNKIRNQAGSFNTRRALIITQFTISQVLIIGMIVIAKQMTYANHSDTGYKKDAIVMVPLTNNRSDIKMQTLRNRLSQIAGVQNVSLCYAAPSSENNSNTNIRYDNRDQDEVFDLTVRPMDDHYISTFGLQLIAGRNVLPADTGREFVVNETFVKKLNLHSPDEVIGKMVRLGASSPYMIVGVVKDFHDRSFHEEINAVGMFSAPSFYDFVAIKLSMENSPRTMSAIEKVYTAVYPDHLYEYKFLDATLESFYRAETLLYKMITSFCVIALLIGSLGLFGLMSFMVVQKNKEIGIRKILGGDMLHILWIFIKEFFMLILVAFFIAGPLAWFVMNSWLEGFKFRIEMSVWMFLQALSFTVIIAMFTVGYQSLRAAMSSPLKQLKKV